MSTHTDLMNSTIGFSSTHLILSFLLFIILLSKPDIVKENYIKIFIYISLLFNFIIFWLFFACKTLSSEGSRHSKLMIGCMVLSLVHFVLSIITLINIENYNFIIAFLLASIFINSLIIYESNNCKNLED